MDVLGKLGARAVEKPEHQSFTFALLTSRIVHGPFLLKVFFFFFFLRGEGVHQRVTSYVFELKNLSFNYLNQTNFPHFECHIIEVFHTSNTTGGGIYINYKISTQDTGKFLSYIHSFIIHFM